jgi:hypothetical protein
MSLARIFVWIKEYAVQESIGIAIAIGAKLLRKGAASDELNNARNDGSMSLTPNGWDVDRSRLGSRPIRPSNR